MEYTYIILYRMNKCFQALCCTDIFRYSFMALIFDMPVSMLYGNLTFSRRWRCRCQHFVLKAVWTCMLIPTFRKNYCPHLQGFYLQVYMLLQPRRRTSTCFNTDLKLKYSFQITFYPSSKNSHCLFPNLFFQESSTFIYTFLYFLELNLCLVTYTLASKQIYLPKYVNEWIKR
jgi:hypothetical protein